MENTIPLAANPASHEALKILKWFRYIKPTDDIITNISSIRSACYQFCELLLETVPPGRERALAITHLEEVSMWANKALVMSQSIEETTDTSS